MNKIGFYSLGNVLKKVLIILGAALTGIPIWMIGSLFKDRKTT